MTQPSAPGFCMPAEWEPHAATWLAWPHYRGDWPGRFEPIPWVFAEIIRNLALHERVELIVQSAAAERRVRMILERAHALARNVRFHHWPTNRIWLRDSGCIFVRSAHKLRAANFRFNAWAKYSNWREDDKLGANMARTTRAAEVQPVISQRHVVLEGGSIDVNGAGTILTTEECLLSKAQERNPGFGRKDYEAIFREFLGASHTIWLGRGITGDDTHGHVDDLARFVSPDTVLTMVEPNRSDTNHVPLRDNLRRLRAARDQNGKRLNIVEAPMPRPVVFEGRRLPASYANFYIANGVVLAPVFNDPNDRIALNTLSELFSSRQVVPIYSGDFIWGLGAMHCMTQQQPAGQLSAISRQRSVKS